MFIPDNSSKCCVSWYRFKECSKKREQRAGRVFSPSTLEERLADSDHCFRTAWWQNQLQDSQAYTEKFYLKKGRKWGKVVANCHIASSVENQTVLHRWRCSIFSCIYYSSSFKLAHSIEHCVELFTTINLFNLFPHRYTQKPFSKLMQYFFRFIQPLPNLI